VKDELGWQPKTTLHELVAEMVHSDMIISANECLLQKQVANSQSQQGN